MSILQNAIDHFADKKTKMKLIKIDVPEWKCALFFRPLNCESADVYFKYTESLKNLDSASASDAVVECLLIRARDEEGLMAFTKASRLDLKTKADPIVMSGIIHRLINEEMKFMVEDEEIKKS